MINPELDARIATWQAAWMDLHRTPIPASPEQAQDYRERSARLLGAAYVLLSDARHDSDASASVMGRIPAAAEIPGMPYPLQISPDSAGDTYPQRFAYAPAPSFEPFAPRDVPIAAELARRGEAVRQYAENGAEGDRPAEARP